MNENPSQYCTVYFIASPNLQQIETSLKRKKTRRWGPRTIDLDILFYGNHKIQEKDLAIPHERLTERAFVLVPLAEIAPSFINPASGQKISWHLDELRS
ncbi:MAG: 2-amino-4-hydroxy-6-hydroxymethyldihydropteridine diphosphokinase, partial [Alkaliphilus sp.]